MKDLITKSAMIKLENAHIRTNFFYRQMTYTNKQCNEILETYIAANPYIHLDHISLITGRYAKLKDQDSIQYLTFNNFFQATTMTPISEGHISRKKIITPISINYTRFYNTKIISYKTEDSEIYEIIFTPKKKVKRAIVEGSVWINPQYLTILKYKGTIKSSLITPGQKHEKILFSNLSFEILYNDSETE
ncbi:hypothetical protein [Halosquirtibacter laminarini]|uniref:hypothetical protein n=1 Tax=Halosquirtibacter laminarini TaxID=3374600 RepID=UPI00374A1BC1